ncbi:MAG: hypothetical protein JKY58_08095 [Pseudomonas sp.]|nr:hypothetical protein [Pseudomonas sp.]
MSRVTFPLYSRPPLFKGGELIFSVPKTMVEKNDEIFLGLQLICNRSLFGQCFRILMPQYFESMGRDSGVMIGGFVPSGKLLKGMTFPGDVDLLIIPYEKDVLVVSQTLAIELKVVRAKYEKQGKSPNQFGFSQATALLEQGFPHAAVVHLIVSDSSPHDKWRKILATRIIDAENGLVEEPWDELKDMLPANLIDRCIGRLEANCKDKGLGLLASYMAGDGIWLPSGRRAEPNPKTSNRTMEAIAEYFNRHFESFLDTPRY